MKWYNRIRYFRVRDAKRAVKLWWQRRTRGWDDSETWNLDTSLAKVILPRLKRFKELTVGCPVDVTWEEWGNTLDTMIKAFEWFAADCNERDEDFYTEAHKGVELFAKYYGHLWW